MIQNVLLVYEEELFADGLLQIIKEILPEVNARKCIIYDDVEKQLIQEPVDMIFICKHKLLDVTHACPIIQTNNPDCKIVFVSGTFTPEDVKRYMEYNIAGVICKKYSTAKIKSIISLLLMGDTYFPSELLPYKNPTFLSKQQLNIVKYLRSGYSNKQIAYD